MTKFVTVLHCNKQTADTHRAPDVTWRPFSVACWQGYRLDVGRVAPSLPRRPGGEIARQTRKLRAGRPVSRARAVSEITRYIRRSREN